jgi:hypothetical protein
VEYGRSGSRVWYSVKMRSNAVLDCDFMKTRAFGIGAPLESPVTSIA